MACACKANAANGQPAPWQLRLASGRVKVYATQVGATGAQANNPGSVVIPPPPVDTPS
jgi:hypothetical protein